LSHRPLNVPLELEEIFTNPLDEPAWDELAPDPFTKFLAAAELHALGIDAQHLERETAPTDRAVAARYAKIAADAAKAENPLQKLEDTLSKRMKESGPRVDVENVGGRRVEKTIYPHGGAVIAEFDERGICVKTYIVEA
jgi:hypothetical protein